MAQNLTREFNEYEVADAYRRAAWELQSGSAGRRERAQLDVAVGNLLEALGRALMRDGESIPDHVQRAALQVAREIPAGGRGRGPDARHGRNGRYVVQPDMGWGAVRGEAVPFATSIRLGRMG
jgi:hypothetical protein